MFAIAQYFDDYFERYVETNLTEEQAKEILKNYSPGVYVSYMVREHIITNNP